MLYRRKTYKIQPEKLETFNKFFHTYLYPNQMRHGSKLVGRWVNEDHTEITAIWEYENMAHYEAIEEKIKQSDLHQKAKEKRQELGNLYLSSSQDFMTSTAAPDTYHPPKHIVAVSGYITNDKGEVLLVRNYHRAGTLEMPGGQVEEGETLEDAVHREIIEETGARVKLEGITGIYQNLTGKVLCVVFRGTYVSGQLEPQEGETSEVLFKKLTKETIPQWITRPHFAERVLDAMNPRYLPYSFYKVKPYELIKRFEG